MFREMRRKKQLLSPEECAAILHRGSCGVLALGGHEDYPYAVPMSYVFDGERLYFHSAKSGHKMDSIQREPKASFCVIDKDQVIPMEYTTYFQSVIAFGAIRILEDERERYAALEKLALKYVPKDTEENRRKVILQEWTSLCMLEMKIAHLSGKRAIELTR